MDLHLPSLAEYILRIGDEAAAELFGVKPRTVAAWRRGERIPRPAQAKRIVAAARGELSYESIYRSPQARAA